MEATDSLLDVRERQLVCTYVYVYMRNEGEAEVDRRYKIVHECL